MEKGHLKKYELLVIGGSAGSLEVIMELLPALSADHHLAIVLVLHSKRNDNLLTSLLAHKVKRKVKEAEEKEKIRPGFIYIAPGDYHLLIEQNRTFSLDYSEKIHYSRPSIDVTFETAAEAYKHNLIGILLSGANTDGTDGIKAIAESGGLTIVQNPAEAAVPFMPQSAIAQVKVDYIATTKEMIAIINNCNK